MYILINVRNKNSKNSWTEAYNTETDLPESVLCGVPEENPTAKDYGESLIEWYNATRTFSEDAERELLGSREIDEQFYNEHEGIEEDG